MFLDDSLSYGSYTSFLDICDYSQESYMIIKFLSCRPLQYYIILAKLKTMFEINLKNCIFAYFFFGYLEMIFF